MFVSPLMVELSTEFEVDTTFHCPPL